MRKIIVLAFISLDGVIQAPGGPQEDTDGSFKYGGWVAPYFDERSGARGRSPRAMVYVENISNELTLSLGLKEVTSGANVTLLEPYDAGVFYGTKEIDGVCVASAIQIYLDLRGFRGRGDEAAAKLLDEVIRPQWQVEKGI